MVYVRFFSILSIQQEHTKMIKNDSKDFNIVTDVFTWINYKLIYIKIEKYYFKFAISIVIHSEYLCRALVKSSGAQTRWVEEEKDLFEKGLVCFLNTENSALSHSLSYKRLNCIFIYLFIWMVSRLSLAVGGQRSPN